VSRPVGDKVRLGSVAGVRRVEFRYQLRTVPSGPVLAHSKEKVEPTGITTGDLVALEMLGRAGSMRRSASFVKSFSFFFNITK